MRHLFVLGVIVGGASLLGCSSDKGSIFAPSGAVVTVRVPTAFMLTNASMTVTVQVRTSDGNAATDGTEVVVSARSGVLNQQKLRTRGGVATVAYRAAAEAGSDVITATTGEARAEATVRIVSGVTTQLTLSANPPELPPQGGTTEVVATLTDANSALVTGAQVTFSVSAGTISPTTTVSDANGQAKALFETTDGATIDAKADGGVSNTIVLGLRATVAVALDTEPDAPNAGDTVTVTITGTASDAEPPTGTLLLRFGDGQSQEQAFEGEAMMTHVYPRAGTFELSATLTADTGSIARTSTTLTVKPPALDVAFDVEPEAPNAGEAVTVTITGTASNGKPAKGTLLLRFGDGKSQEQTFRNEATLTHVYQRAGTFELKATLTADTGMIARATTMLTVGAPTLAVTLTVAPAAPSAGDTVTVTVTGTASDGKPPTGTVSVGFGDGQSQEQTFRSEATLTHVYQQAGTFELEATLTADTGTTARTTTTLLVSPSTQNDELDLNLVDWLHTDVSDWPATSTVTDVSIGFDRLCIEHTKSGEWPELDDGGTAVEGNLWIFANIDGQWYGATWEWLRPGQTCKSVTASEIGPRTKRSPLETWKPRSGEKIGLMVSTPARLGPEGPTRESSNVKVAYWP